MNSEILKIPKVELHMHLDGSVPIPVLEKLSGLSYEEVYNKAVSINDLELTDYLKRFDFINKYLQTKENLELVSNSLGCELEKENVIYAEVRFAPMLHTKEGLTPEEVVEAVKLGFSKCNVRVNLILCMLRGMDLSFNKKTIELAKRYLNNGVVAIDLAGDEKTYPFTLYQDLFDECKSLGIPVTIHAGEVNKRDIKDIIPYTKRIGHGIKMYDDPELMNLVKSHNILLEVCPNSNLDTNNVSDYSHHPIKKLYQSGLKISVNTDNRTVSNISLTEEYNSLINLLGFSLDDIVKMNLNAIDYAFISETEKEELRKKIKNLD